MNKRLKQEGPLDRPNSSRVLAETRKTSRLAFDFLPPGRRMEAAFIISMDARKLHIAGLRAQGLSETEIRAIMSAKQR
jgi:hypothetical protein